MLLHGWGDDGQPAKISERIGDVFIRNVTTDIRRYFGDDSSGEMIKDGNSIFIFEVAGLCIGHLGHLHHKLDDSRFMTPLDEFMRKIGQQFAIDTRTERTLTISRETLPSTPTVIILQGV